MRPSPTRPLIKIGLAWLVATGAAVALGVVAVGVVSDSVTENRPARLSALGVREALVRTETTTGPGPAATAPEPSTTSSSRPAGSPTTTRPVSPRPTTSTTGPATATTAGPSTSVPEDRTYQLEGGTVGVRFENGGARLLFAAPKPGYQVDSGGSSGRVDVRFRSENHESRLRAFWDNGPQAEIEERNT